MSWTQTTLIPIAVAAAAATAVAVVGALATDTGPWYQRLAKPSWQPPDWLFAPAWTIIFALIAASAVKSWWDVPAGGARQYVVLLFLLNGALNALWSVLFFALRRPDWALAEVSLLWLSIVALIYFIRDYSELGAWFLVPYLLWVSFASILNFAIVRLNPRF
jgi:tryptophan-rich sensory protein